MLKSPFIDSYKKLIDAEFYLSSVLEQKSNLALSISIENVFVSQDNNTNFLCLTASGLSKKNFEVIIDQYFYEKDNIIEEIKNMFLIRNNVIIHAESSKYPKLGIDFHDTITYNPDFFKFLIQIWRNDVFIVTGTPASQADYIKQELNKLNITGYTGILYGFEYDKREMTEDHFHKMKKHKLSLLQSKNIKLYFDDNPYYTSFLKEYGILVFQPSLNKKYLDKFSKKDPYFTCHLQEIQNKLFYK